MTRYQHFLAWLAASGVIWIFVLLFVNLFMGQPPKHCRYFVPVLGHPHIYSCSEHARPVKP